MNFISEDNIFLNKIRDYLINNKWNYYNHNIVYNYNSINIEYNKYDIRYNLLLTYKHIRRYLGLYNVDIYNHIGNIDNIINFYILYNSFKYKKYILKTYLIDFTEYNYDFKYIYKYLDNNLIFNKKYILRPYEYNIIKNDILNNNIEDIKIYLYNNKYNCSRWSIIEYNDFNNIIVNCIIIIDSENIYGYIIDNIDKKTKKIIKKIFRSNFKKLILNKFCDKAFEIIQFEFNNINNKIRLFNIICDYNKFNNINISDILNLILYNKFDKYQLLYKKKYVKFNKYVIKSFLGYSFNRIENFLDILNYYIENIKKYQLKFIYDIEFKSLKYIKNKNIIDNKFNGKYTTLIRLTNEYKIYNKITNMFIEKCNIRCKFNNYKTLYDISNDKKIILDGIIHLYNTNLDITRDNLTSFLYNKTKICSYFPVNIAYRFYKYFNAISVLDISAGWGDRLIAACISDIIYYSCDPNKCNKPYYDQIIDILGNKNKQKIITSGFEDLIINNNFDLIFSSPPFFDLEIYSNDKDQSNLKYLTSKSWINNFLYVVIVKAWKYLNINGHMCLYMNDYNNLNYCENMILYCINNLEKCKYLGVINIIVIENDDIDKFIEKADLSKKKVQPLWIFKKIS